jgi:hypothetical protein
VSLSHQKSVGSDHTLTIASLSLAFAALIAAAVTPGGSPDAASLLVLFASSLFFVSLAARAWLRYTRQTAPSLSELHPEAPHRMDMTDPNARGSASGPAQPCVQRGDGAPAATGTRGVS